MTRTLMAAAAVGALTLSAAMAQSPSSTMPTQSGPPAAASGTLGANTANPGAHAIPMQAPNQWLFSKFKGTDVIGADDAKIGDVSDVLFDKTGQVNALIIGVGGFLGIGAKDVALPVASFVVVPDTKGGADKLRLSMTKDQLNQTAAFKPQTPATTTGSAPSTPAPSAPAPR